MSKIPDTKKTKYNKTDPFRWVDSQWEKFMTEQKELKARISELEEENNNLRKDLEDLVKRTPSKFLSKQSDYSKPNWTPEQIAYWDKMIKQAIKDTMKSNERTDEWRIEQFNRNRAPEDQVSNIQEMSDKVSDMFDNEE